jgi:hypothetical protein
MKPRIAITNRTLDPACTIRFPGSEFRRTKAMLTSSNIKLASKKQDQINATNDTPRTSRSVMPYGIFERTTCPVSSRPTEAVNAYRAVGILQRPFAIRSVTTLVHATNTKRPPIAMVSMVMNIAGIPKLNPCIPIDSSFESTLSFLNNRNLVVRWRGRRRRRRPTPTENCNHRGGLSRRRPLR